MIYVENFHENFHENFQIWNAPRSDDCLLNYTNSHYYFSHHRHRRINIQAKEYSLYYRHTRTWLVIL